MGYQPRRSRTMSKEQRRQIIREEWRQRKRDYRKGIRKQQKDNDDFVNLRGLI